MAKTDRAFVIPFVGLKIGMHTFEFDITNAFFEQVEYSLIEKGNVHVTLNLEKKETMMVGDFTINGKVETSCDLCNDPVEVDIEGEYQLIFKFDDKPTDDESLIIVYPEEFEIDIRENLLELISVSLPSRTIHPDGECNEEMLELLNEYRINADDEDFDDEDFEEAEDMDEESDEDDEYIDPRWAALKGLNNNEE
ncbi:MAG: DUF177 domain-containing protein [bacterium]|nr:DUF177 domain-containing protein [bacterium]